MTASTVALFDVLGFRQFLMTTPLDEAVSRVEEVDGMVDRAAVSLRERARTWNLPGEAEEIRAIRFSDTILLHVPATDAFSFAALVFVARELLVASMRAGIPLRGAVTTGDLHVSRDGKTYIGQALVRAYDLEQLQEWAGAIIDPATDRVADTHFRSYAWAVAEIDGDVVEYPAPLKKGRVGPVKCLGWPRDLGLDPTALEAKLSAFGGPPEWPGRSKLDATMKFFDFHRAAHSGPRLTDKMGKGRVS